jgi:hypothetical protein
MEAEQMVVAVWDVLCVHVLRRALYPSLFGVSMLEIPLRDMTKKRRAKSPCGW